MAGFDFGLELACGVAIFGEDGGAVAPFVRVNEIDSILKGLASDDLHDWSEDFLFVAVDTLTHVINDGWSNEVSIGIALDLHTATIEEHLAVLLTIGNQALNFGQMLSVLKGSDVRIVPAGADRQSFRLLDDLRDPLSRVTHQNDHREGHAPLASRAEAGTDHTIDGVILVGVGHHNAVVLRTHVHLCALTVSAGSSVDVLTSFVCANKAYSLDVRVGADVSHGVATALDHIDDAIGDARLLEQVDQELRCSSDSLGRLEHVGVAKRDREREHPQRDHRREVIWSNASHDSHWLPVRVDVDTCGDTLSRLTLTQGSEAASVLDDFVATEHITSSVSKRLAVLFCNKLTQLVRVLLQKLLILEHVAHFLCN